MPNSIENIRKLGTIVQIIGNNSSHFFDMHSYVIIAAHHASPATLGDSYTYGYGLNKTSGQFLTTKCAVFCDFVDVPNGMEASPEELQEILVKWASSKKNANYSIHFRPARTQKARGLQALTISSNISKLILLVRSPEEIEYAVKRIKFPIMARPCPRKPRHGFIESRVVRTRKGLTQLVQATMEADPHGEVILMAPVKAEYSAVVTESSITLGAKRNGATTGKHCIAIPCHTNLESALNLGDTMAFRRKNGHRTHTRIATFMGIKPKDGIFVETVGSELVQVRTGPKYESDKARFSTKSTIRPIFVYEVPKNMDFIEYETKLGELGQCASEPAQVLVLQYGASLTSHYMVQAISRGFSVATDIKAIAPHSMVLFDTQKDIFPTVTSIAYRNAIMHTLQCVTPIKPTSETLQWAVSIIQGIGPTNHNQASINLLLGAAILIAKAGAGICLGEYRHFFRVGPGRFGIIASAPVSFPHEDEYHYHKGTLDRSLIFEAAFNLPWQNKSTWFDMSSVLSRVKADYEISNGWAPGYGGLAWGQCTDATVKLLLALIPFVLTCEKKLERPLDRTFAKQQISQVIQAANRLITVSHNSNKCLTKIIPGAILRDISNGHTGLTIATTPLTWDLVKEHVS